MIKGLFHCSDLNLAKELGITHISIELTAFPGDFGGYMRMREWIIQCHQVGVYCLICPFDRKNLNVSYKEGLAFLNDIANAKILDVRNDIIMLPDEPNLFGPDPGTINEITMGVTECIENIRTLVVLSDIRPWAPYANCADIIAIDYDGKMNWWNRLWWGWKIKRFQRLHKGQLWGIPPVRYSGDQIQRHKKFWNDLGVENLIWYCATPDQEKWSDKPLQEISEWKEALMEK